MTVAVTVIGIVNGIRGQRGTAAVWATRAYGPEMPGAWREIVGNHGRVMRGRRGGAGIGGEAAPGRAPASDACRLRAPASHWWLWWCCPWGPLHPCSCCDSCCGYGCDCSCCYCCVYCYCLCYCSCSCCDHDPCGTWSCFCSCLHSCLTCSCLSPHQLATCPYPCSCSCPCCRSCPLHSSGPSSLAAVPQPRAWPHVPQMTKAAPARRTLCPYVPARPHLRVQLQSQRQHFPQTALLVPLLVLLQAGIQVQAVHPL